MDVAQLVTVLIILLLVATGMALLSRWLKVSYVMGLVLAGLLNQLPCWRDRGYYCLWCEPSPVDSNGS